MADISKTGVWIDTKTGQVVTSPPAEGIQLVAPGNEITPNAQRLIDDAKAVEDARAPAAPENTAKKASRKR